VKLLCDEMLMRLGRWLRAAGYDTAIAAPGMPDRDLIGQARREQRLLITRDRKMSEYRGASGCVLVLAGNKLQECVQELSDRPGIDWLHDPFSRCLLCNTPLEPGSDAMLQRIPLHSRRDVSEVYYCPGCRKPFWHGGHVLRMRRKLAGWNRGKSGITPPDRCQQGAGNIVPEAEQGAGQRRKR